MRQRFTRKIEIHHGCIFCPTHVVRRIGNPLQASSFDSSPLYGKIVRCLQGGLWGHRPPGCERSHMHVKKGDGRGKIWLEPEVEVFYLRGFKQQEQRQIMALIIEHFPHLKQQWDAYCNHG